MFGTATEPSTPFAKPYKQNYRARPMRCSYFLLSHQKRSGKFAVVLLIIDESNFRAILKFLFIILVSTLQI